MSPPFEPAAARQFGFETRLPHTNCPTRVADRSRNSAPQTPPVRAHARAPRRMPPKRILTPYGTCIVTRAGYWRTVMVPRAPDCRYRRVRTTPGSGSSGNSPTTGTGFTNRNPSTGDWKAPAIETGISDAEDCDYDCEQEVFAARDRYNRGESSEDELRDEVCSAIAWQTGHACAE